MYRGHGQWLPGSTYLPVRTYLMGEGKHICRISVQQGKEGYSNKMHNDTMRLLK